MTKVWYWTFYSAMIGLAISERSICFIWYCTLRMRVGRTPPPYRDPPDIFWTQGCSSWRGSPSLLQASGGWRAEPWSTEHDTFTFTPLSNLSTSVTLSKKKSEHWTIGIHWVQINLHVHIISSFMRKPSIRSRLRIRIHDICTERIRIQHVKMFWIGILVLRFRMPNFQNCKIIQILFDFWITTLNICQL